MTFHGRRFDIAMIERTRTRETAGFTIIEIMITILLISILMAIAVPSFMSARERTHTKACISQLRQIKYAKELWAMDNRKSETDPPPVWDELHPDYLRKQPECPAGGEYAINDINTDPTCSIGGTHRF